MDNLEQHEISEHTQVDEIKKQFYDFLRIQPYMLNHKDKMILEIHVNRILELNAATSCDKTKQYLTIYEDEVYLDFLELTKFKNLTVEKEYILNHPKTRELCLTKELEDFLKYDLKDIDNDHKRKRMINELSYKVSITYGILKDYESICNF